MNDDRRAGLLRAKLSALVRDLRGEVGEDPELIGSHAAVLVEGVLYLLAEAALPSTLSSVLVLASRRGASEVVVFADEGGPALARLAGYFVVPVQVRAVVGGTSKPVEPEPLPVVMPGPTGAEALLEVLRAEGLEVVLEDGTWRGELNGLEVARIVVWPVESGGDGELHIEAGVGRFDRDASAAMNQGEDPIVTLRRAVRSVSEQRHSDAAPHPLGLMSRSRWLRSAALADPGIVGAEHLSPVQTSFPAASVRDVVPAATLGVDPDGAAVLVVFAAGASLDLVPVAADTRALHDPAARLRLVVPTRDHLPLLDDLAAGLREPCEVLDVATLWS